MSISRFLMVFISWVSRDAGLVFPNKIIVMSRPFIACCFLGFAVLASLDLPAQVLRNPMAASYPGLSAYSKNTDIFCVTANQASLANLQAPAAGLFAENRFLLEELKSCTLVLGLPTRSGNFGLHLSYSGFSLFNETSSGLAYARALGENVDLGVQFNFHGIQMAGYGAANAISFEAGAVFHPDEKLAFGIHVDNPAGGRFFKLTGEKIPAIYTIGIGYEASAVFSFAAEMVKEENMPVNVNAGFQYRPIPKLVTKAGVSSTSSSLWFGAGFLFDGSFRMDILSSYHPRLGISPGLMLVYSFRSKQPQPNGSKQE